MPAFFSDLGRTMSFDAFWLPAFWGLIVLVSWGGWGSVIARMVAGERSAGIGWGLRAGWGMAFTLAIGGILVWLHLAIPPLVVTLVVAGAVLAGWDVYHFFRTARHCRHLFRRARSWSPALALFWAVGITGYAGSVASSYFNESDDLPAYIPFVQKMLATGTLLEPFSWRRLATYGGQTFLQCQIAVVGTDLNAFMIDKGLSLVVVLALIAGMFRRRRSKWVQLAMMLVCLLMALVIVPRVNTQSQLSGLALFLTLLRTQSMRRAAGRPGYCLPVTTALVSAGLCALRMTYVPIVVATLALSAAGSILHRRGGRSAALSAAVTHALIALGVTALLLLPWTLQLYESSRSLFYPLMRGNQQPEYDALFTGSDSILQRIDFSISFMSYGRMILAILPIALVLQRRWWSTLLPFYLTAIAGAALIAVNFSTGGYFGLYRYCYPFLLAAVLASLAIALQTRRRPILVAASFAMGIALIVFDQPAGLLAQYGLARDASRAASGKIGLASAEYADEYRLAQESIPPGATILAIVTPIHLLDQRRNGIISADLIGLASPHSAMPLSSGPDALRIYLRAQGIQYVMASDFDAALGIYGRRGYLAIGEHPETFKDLSRSDILVARWMLHAMTAFDQLMPADRLMYRSHEIRVLRID
jgi:hypothetical protein